jgi:hypothetical protein
MAHPTFKQFLIEVMVDMDPTQDPTTQLQQVRKNQLIAKRSPERLAKQELNKAKEQTAIARASTDEHTKALQIQIARKREELARLQQRLIALQKTQPTGQG